jgi:hypothetical protein
MGGSLVWDRGAVTSVGCMASLLDWRIGGAAPSCAGSAVLGLGVLTATVEEELAFADTVNFRKSVVGPVACLACPSVPLRTISSSK